MTSPLIIKIAQRRGISSDDLESFLNPDYDQLSDPFMMHDMSVAVTEIFHHIELGNKIAIYADYDADGIPGAALLSNLFHKIGYPNIVVYIPHRHREGYGFHKPAIKQLADQGVSLIITVDVGVTAVAETAYARSLGLSVIITDHHEPGPELPDTIMVHPKLGTYTDPMICGCAVAFQLARALISSYSKQKNPDQTITLHNLRDASAPAVQGMSSIVTTDGLVGVNEIPPGWEKWLLDMVGIATIGDMVPLVKENRILAYWGLHVLRKSRRSGIIALCRELGIDQSTLSEEDLGFSIIPRINAASRMSDPIRAYELLTTDNPATAQIYATELSDLNTKRKNEVASIMRKANNIMNKTPDRPVIVIGDPSWNVGVVGIVAGKIAEEYQKPTFVWTEYEGEYIKGSCRSNGSVSVVAMMEYASEAFIYQGGHAAAGGFTAYKKDLSRIEEMLSQALEHQTDITEQTTLLDDNYDAEITLSEITMNLYQELSQLAPFGVGNPRPVFLIRGMAVQETGFLGKGEQHLKLLVSDKSLQSNNARPIEMILFSASLSSPFRSLVAGDTFDALVAIESNSFRGRTTLRLKPIEIML
jgi:single-stranded-DNA-specific exonuclease